MSVFTTFTPLISFLYKSGFEDRAIRVEGFSAGPSGSAGLFAQIRWNPLLTGDNFDNPRNHIAQETALQTDFTATALSGGHTLYQDIIPPGGNNASEAVALDRLDLPIAPGQPVVLCARTLTAASEDVSAVFRMKEEW